MATNEDKQMVLAFMADEVDVDPVSGNEVPPGSLPEEVRDDIPARLSEGEYVVPADVLRFYGMKFFEDLRENAKVELARMDREGRIGGEPIPNEELSDEEKADLDSIGAAVGGFITGQPTQSTMPDPYQQQQMMYQQGAPVAMGNAGYAPGGTVTAADDDIDSTQPTYTDQQLRNAFAPGFSFLDSPVDSGETSSVILYGPSGEVVTLFLPAQKDLYDEYIEKGYSTEQVKVTTETEVGQPQGGGGGSAPQQEVEDINLEDMGDDALLKTARGFGVLNNVATAVASAAGLPIAAIVNTSMIAKYNDTLDELNSREIDHGLERKGSIFGGESSLFDGLEDTDGIAGASFGDTWLGDLLGFDKKGFGVQAKDDQGNLLGLKASFGGARRDGNTNKGGSSGSSNNLPTASEAIQQVQQEQEDNPTEELSETEVDFR
jgi:hypothetical protein